MKSQDHKAQNCSKLPLAILLYPLEFTYGNRNSQDQKTTPGLEKKKGLKTNRRKGLKGSHRRLNSPNLYLNLPEMRITCEGNTCGTRVHSKHLRICVNSARYEITVSLIKVLSSFQMKQKQVNFHQILKCKRGNSLLELAGKEVVR